MSRMVMFAIDAKRREISRGSRGQNSPFLTALAVTTYTGSCTYTILWQEFSYWSWTWDSPLLVHVCSFFWPPRKQDTCLTRVFMVINTRVLTCDSVTNFFCV